MCNPDFVTMLFVTSLMLFIMTKPPSKSDADIFVSQLWSSYKNNEMECNFFSFYFLGIKQLFCCFVRRFAE